MEKQTAVTWLEEQLRITPKPIFNSDIDKLFDQAKAIEKQQKLDFFNAGYREGFSDAKSGDDNGIDIADCGNAEEYFESTYKTNL
jgi:hypothetical protein